MKPFENPEAPLFALIGGTGLYRLQELASVDRIEVATPFGAASGAILVGQLGACRVTFLARHGESHSILPHRVNYRANLWALHSLGVRRVLGVNAVGGIRGDMPPRTLVLPHQLIDYTHGRLSSFSDVDGAAVQHVDFSAPYTESLRSLIAAAAKSVGTGLIGEGTYGATQGPRLETVAEITRMRRDGCDLVGMTGMPEAVLARELELEYASICLVANWAAGCGPEGEPPAAEISIDEIYAHLEHATAQVSPILQALGSALADR